MANYQEVRAELTNTQLNKFKSAAKNKKGTILRILRLTHKNFEDEELLHQLFLTTKISNAFANNMSTDMKSK